MSEFNISIPVGQRKRLLTGRKYCPEDIQITAQPFIIEKDVNFHDYDGTLLYSYTLEEAQVLPALPPLPEHDGLICQGWNWTLEAVHTLTRPMTIGAMYITDDGATRLYIKIPQSSRRTIPLYFSQSAERGVTIDWGDGSTEILAGIGVVNTFHTYSTHGDYVIRLIPAEGCALLLGEGVTNSGIFGPATETDFKTRYLQNMLMRAEIGSQISEISPYAFWLCVSLHSVTIPFGVTNINGYSFANCKALYGVTLPSSIPKNIGMYCFFNDHSLTVVSLPYTLKRLDSTSEFQSCHSLKKIDIPDGVGSIGWAVLRDCVTLRSINKSSATTLGASCCRYCSSLSEAQIGDHASSIGAYQFDGCYCLSRLIITSPITSIGASAFNNCYAMAEYDFTLCTSVPTLEHINAFANIPADCIIKVPAALYAEWSTATNWSVYANHFQGV